MKKQLFLLALIVSVSTAKAITVAEATANLDAARNSFRKAQAVVSKCVAQLATAYKSVQSEAEATLAKAARNFADTNKAIALSAQNVSEHTAADLEVFNQHNADAVADNLTANIQAVKTTQDLHKASASRLNTRKALVASQREKNAHKAKADLATAQNAQIDVKATNSAATQKDADEAHAEFENARAAATTAAAKAGE
jgi:hypothetical protein